MEDERGVSRRESVRSAGAAVGGLAVLGVAAPISEVSRETPGTGDRLAAWTGSMGLDQMEVKDSAYGMVSTTRDPALSFPRLKRRGSKSTSVVVGVRVSQAGVAQLF